MSRKSIFLALACVAAHSTTVAAADLGEILSFNAFGTLGVVHSNEDRADFLGSIVQPDGAGYSNSWDFGPDSKIAGQMHAAFSERFSATLQVVAQHAYDDTWTPQVEWANLKYKVTENLDVRAGRVVLPTFMISETRLVGYASALIRLPQEVYQLNPITSNDGLDVTYRSKFGAIGNSVQVFYGSNTTKLSTGDAKSHPAWGITDTITLGDLTAHAGFSRTRLDLDIESLEGLFVGLRGLGTTLNDFGFQTAGGQAIAIAEKYKLTDIMIDIYSLGASYDPGKWFVMGEAAYSDSEGLLGDSVAWYVHGGYRIGKFTPYAAYASLDSKIDHEQISTAGLPELFAAGVEGLSAGFGAVQAGFAGAQHSVSVGLRWDFISNADLKVQYDRLMMDEGTWGRLMNVQPNLPPNGTLDLISIAVDFVF